MSSRGAAMRTSREESSAGGVASRAKRACRQTPAMEEGTGVNPGSSPGCNVLNSPSLRSLVGGECLQILRCGICMEFFNIPIVLPCGHTFCLQCLTEMCKHAIRPRGPNPVVTEVLIGCPNCRVQIFATPILQRNVTCNFIIQSLVDMLRNRKVPKKKDVSVNTERSLIGPRVRAISEVALCGVLQDIDRLSASLEHRSVVDDAFFEIENIRRLHLSNQEKASGDSLGAQTNSIVSPGNHGVCCTSDSTPQPDSSTTTQTECTQHSPNHDTTSQNSKKCYAAALASGKDRPAVTTASSNISSVVNTRVTRLPVNTARTSSGAPCGARTLRLLPVQNPPSGFRNRNRNNSKTSAHLGTLQPESDTGHAQCCARHRPFLSSAGSKRTHPYEIDVVFVARHCDVSTAATVKQQDTIKRQQHSGTTLANKQGDFYLQTTRKLSRRDVCLSADTNPENLSPEKELSSSASAGIRHDATQGQGHGLNAGPSCFYDPDVVNLSWKGSERVVRDRLLPETVGQTKSPVSILDEDAFADNGQLQSSDVTADAKLSLPWFLESS